MSEQLVIMSVLIALMAVTGYYNAAKYFKLKKKENGYKILTTSMANSSVVIYILTIVLFIIRSYFDINYDEWINVIIIMYPALANLVQSICIYILEKNI